MDPVHEVESGWKEAEVVYKAERVLALMAWLDHTMDIVEMLSDDEVIRGELRGVAASVRTKRDDITSDVERLKAEISDRKNK